MPLNKVEEPGVIILEGFGGIRFLTEQVNCKESGAVIQKGDKVLVLSNG